MDRFEELLASLFDGSLSEAEEEELASLVRRSEPLGRELRDLAGVDALLRAEFAPRELDEKLAERISMCLVGPEREEETARRIVERISRRQARPWKSSAIGPHLWYLAAACAALAAGAWFLFARASSEKGPVLVGAGPGVAILRSGRELQAAAGLALLPGDRVRTRGASGAAVRWDAEGARLALGRNAEIAFPAGCGSVEIALGELVGRFSKRSSGQPFRLVSPHAVAEVLGTELSLTVDRVATRLEVARGRVMFTRSYDGASTEVRTGLAAVAAPGAELEPRLVTGSRVREGLAALYQFNEGGGSKILDVSGTGADADLTLGDESAVQWIASAISITAPTSARTDKALPLRASGAARPGGLTLEAWVTPSELTSDGWWGRACFLSLWSETPGWELALGQGAEYGRSAAPAFYVVAGDARRGTQGEPVLESTSPGGTGRPVHVLATVDRDGELRLYLNGEETGRARLPSPPPSSGEEFGLSVGCDSAGASNWLGQVHMVAVYDRALSPAEASRNCACGKD